MPHAEIMFDQPQPEGEKNLNAIPGILYGRYLSPSDSALLIVSEKEIVLKTIWDVNFSLTELDSVGKLNLKDTVYHDDSGSMSVRIKNDSVYQRSISFDTLNYSSGHYVLKEVKGYIL